MENNVVIWGATGMDGSKLCELYAHDYNVIGVKRRTSTNNIVNLIPIMNHPNFNLVEGDITDSGSVNNIMSKYKPIYCVNTSSQSHVATSFEQPSYTFDVVAKGVLYLLEAIKNYSPYTKLLQCSSSEMFGDNYTTDNDGTKYQDEQTALSPNSPYAVAKVAAHNLVRIYRKSYNLFCATAITFNHEGIRRGENFVTRKITKWIASANKGLGYTISGQVQEPMQVKALLKLSYPKLKLGNIDSVRDFGDSDDYCEVFMKILQHTQPDDYVICTGVGHSIRDFLEEAFGYIGQNWQDYVEIDPTLYRPYEVPFLCGRCTKANNILGWKSTVNFQTLVRKMVLHDLQEANLSEKNQ
jgi:GDPmannose 4,6-dehydratase